MEKKIGRQHEFSKFSFLVVGLLLILLILSACGDTPTPQAVVIATAGANILPFSGLTPGTVLPTPSGGVIPPTVTPRPANLPTVTPQPEAPATANLQPVPTLAPTTTTAATSTAASTTTVAPTSTIAPTTTTVAAPTNTPVPPTPTPRPPTATPTTVAPTTAAPTPTATLSALKELWRTNIALPVPLVWNNQVVTRNAEGQLQNIRLDDGTAGIAYGSKDLYAGYVVGTTGRLFTVEGDGEFLASYDVNSGKQIFRVSHKRQNDQHVVDGVVSAVAQGDNTVLVGTFNNDNSGAVDATNYDLSGVDGSVRWSVDALVGTSWEVVGNVAILRDFGTLTGYDLPSGHQIWQIKGDLPLTTLADNSTIYAVNHAENAVTPGPVSFIAYNAADGKPKWKRDYQGNLSAFFIDADNSRIYGYSSDSSAQKTTIYALDAAKGAEIWKQDVAYSDNLVATLNNKSLYVAEGNSIRVLDATTGKTKSRISTSLKAIDWLDISGGKLLVSEPGDNNNTYNLIAYSLPS